MSVESKNHPVLQLLGVLGSLILWFWIPGLLSGCERAESPFKAESETLRKRLVKQESMFQSLQDGNKVMQQQIDLLNRELREAQKRAETAEGEREQALAQLQRLTAQNEKLSKQVKWARAKHSEVTKAIHVENKGAQTRELRNPLRVASKAAEEALSKNGYTLRVSLKTDGKAVFVTDRKVSAPSSLEVAGFRNQYVVSLRALPSKSTLLSVKADFEKTVQAGGILVAGPEETADIERRLIGEIVKKLAGSNNPPR